MLMPALRWTPAATVLVLVAGCATTRSFESLDADANGRVDYQEASRDPAVIEYFRSADDDGSGDLDPDEFGSILDMIQRERRDIPRRSDGKGNVSVGR